MMSDERKACEDGDTIAHWHCQGEMHECVHCGSQVQWDLVDHAFFGFRATCPERRAKAKEADPNGGGHE